MFAGNLRISDLVALARALRRHNTSIPEVASHPKSSVECIALIELSRYLFAAIGISDNATGPSALGATEICIKSSTTTNICFSTKKPDLQQVIAAIRRYEGTGEIVEFVKVVIRAFNDTVAAIRSAGITDTLSSDPFEALVGAPEILKQHEKHLQLMKAASVAQTDLASAFSSNPPPKRKGAPSAEPQVKRVNVSRPRAIRQHRDGDTISIGMNYFSLSSLKSNLGGDRACPYVSISNKDTHSERVAYCPYGSQCIYSHEFSAYPQHWFTNKMAQRCRVKKPQDF